MDLVRSLPLTYLHVFTYSDRRGTEAARMGTRVPGALIRERSRRLRALGAEKNLAFRRRLVGRSVDALVLEDKGPGRAGLTANYVEVAFDAPEAPARGFVRLRVTEADARGTRGVMEAV